MGNLDYQLAFFVAIISLTSACPDDCTCSGFVVNCTNGSWKEIPSVPFSTQILILANNSINNISHHPYIEHNKRLRKLGKLDLRYNNLTSLHDENFAGFPSLNELLLDFNNIAFPDSVLFPFDRLESSLRNLSLSHNQIKGKLKQSYFFNLDKIESLNISYNRLIEIGMDTFSFSLHRLDLSYNQISVIGPDSFFDLPYLRYLDIRGLRMQTFDTHVLRNLANLQILKLGGKNLSNISEVLFGIPSNLTTLEIVDSQISMLHDSLLRYCSGISSLRLSNNRLKSLSATFFSFTPNLKQLNLERNLLSQPDVMISAWLLPLSIEVLNLNYNLLLHFPTALLESHQSLHTINISNNLLVGIGRLRSPSLISLDLSDNFITDFRPKAFKACPALSTVNISGNKFTNFPKLIKNNSLEVFVDGNPWNCSCDFFTSFNRLPRTRHVKFLCTEDGSLKCLRCASPLRLNGTAAVNLTEENYDSCILEPNINSSSSPTIAIAVVISVVVFIVGFTIFFGVKKKYIRKSVRKKQNETENTNVDDERNAEARCSSGCDTTAHTENGVRFLNQKHVEDAEVKRSNNRYQVTRNPTNTNHLSSGGVVLIDIHDCQLNDVNENPKKKVLALKNKDGEVSDDSSSSLSNDANGDIGYKQTISVTVHNNHDSRVHHLSSDISPSDSLLIDAK